MDWQTSGRPQRPDPHRPDDWRRRWRPHGSHVFPTGSLKNSLQGGRHGQRQRERGREREVNNSSVNHTWSSLHVRTLFQTWSKIENQDINVHINKLNVYPGHKNFKKLYSVFFSPMKTWNVWLTIGNIVLIPQLSQLHQPPPAPSFFIMWGTKVMRRRRRRCSHPWTARDWRRKDRLRMQKEKGRELRHDSLLLFPHASHLLTERTAVRKRRRKMGRRRGA